MGWDGIVWCGCVGVGTHLNSTSLVCEQLVSQVQLAHLQ